MTTPTHGGTRNNSGRKPLGLAKRVTRSINLTRDAWANLDLAAHNRGISASELCNRWATKLKP